MSDHPVETGAADTGPDTGRGTGPSTGPHLAGPPGDDHCPAGVGARTDAHLVGLDALPVDEHVGVYDEVHRDLRDTLAGGGPAGR